MDMMFGMGLVMIPVVLFMFMLPIALLVALQVWLCRKGKWLGLILPGISLALSLVMAFSMAAFSTLTVGGNTMVSGGAVQVPAQEEDYVESPAQEGVPGGEREKTEFHPEGLITAGVLFLVMNIPTVVFGGIWLHYKGRRDTLEDLKKMRIEDLE
ncbi:hypothetical protein AALA83_13060 [Oscillospiraceae bacterium 44-5]|jgi:hypothetical protein|uniref:hypothetical protein n=1 Tax=Lawsonibacter sp. JLR.KK007 TaxID=3114293 RepID=UPI00216EF1F0|nr:hypothetical protein [Lawsonibacter sp.]